MILIGLHAKGLNVLMGARKLLMVSVTTMLFGTFLFSNSIGVALANQRLSSLYSLKVGHNSYRPETPQEWQEHLRHAELDPLSYVVSVKDAGDFTRAATP